jgi:linoleoyl-CoA desaturase
MISHTSLAPLYEEFVKRGWHRKVTARILLELLINLFISLAGMVIFLAWENPFVRVCGIIVSTAGSIGVGTNTHTSSHYATSNKRWVNESLTYFGYPCFLGLSATYWWHKHLAIHHLAPNVIGVDEDADLSPWFAMTEAEAARGGRLRRFYYAKLQWIIFPLLVSVNGFNMQKSGFSYLIRMLSDQQTRKKAHWIDLAALLLFFAIWVVVPLFYYPLMNVVGFYILRISLIGYAMFAVFAPGHLPGEAVRFSKDQRGIDRILLQTAASMNFRTGVLGRFICSGLDYQIEHHLFPQLNHIYYRRMSPMVQRFCQDNGLPYRTFGWDYALWKSWMVFRTPQPVKHSVEAVQSLISDKV